VAATEAMARAVISGLLAGDVMVTYLMVTGWTNPSRELGMQRLETI